jgi:hypothetical protein
MESFAVLHITSLPGGGVDRHVRDIARGSSHPQLVWHTAPGADVMELPAEGRYISLDPAAIDRDSNALASWLRAQRVGVVHAHGTSERVEARASWAARALGVRFIATLHDILFLRADAFEKPAAPPDPAWLARNQAFLAEAAAVVVPSDYLAGRAERAMPSIATQVVANGSPTANSVKGGEAHPAFLERKPRAVAAVIGAIGPHKGADIVDRLSAELEGSGIAIVVIGYLDRQVLAGWRDAHVFIHGAYDDEEVPALLRAYGAKLALFPNRVPESFSYTLSDAWSAGLPALVPPDGALAERVLRHDGGWLLPEGFGAREVAAELRRLLGPEGAAELARVESRIAAPGALRVPSLENMTRSLDAFYDRFGIDPGKPPAGDSPQLSSLVAKNLDGALFRIELVRLADEYRQLRESLERIDRERLEAGKSADDARRWGEKLSADVQALQSDVTREVEERRRVAAENEQLRLDSKALALLPRWLSRLLRKIAHERS